MNRKQTTVFMMDLLATVPYYTAYLSRALLDQGAALTVGSISYYLDPDCFTSRNLQLDPGFIDAVGKFALPTAIRRPLKLFEAIVNIAALTVRFLIKPPAILHVQYLPMAQRSLPLDRWFVSFSRMRGAKIILTVHDILPHDSADQYRQIFARIYHAVDGLICHSDHIKTRLMLEFRVPAEKLWTIPHGPFFFAHPPNDDAETRQRLRALPNELIVLWQGIVFPYKGLEVLLDAWQQVEARISGARLIVLGTGAPHILDQIRSRVARLNLSRVTLLLRFASTKELIATYRAADVVVYPYLTITTSGALATGMALNKAIVASDLPVFRELLTSGRDALLVEPGNPMKLSEAIQSLLADHALRERLVSALASSQDGVQAWRSIARQTLHVYASASRCE